MLQGIYAKGGEGDVFRFGCFAKAEAIPGKTFRIAAAVIYADGTHKWENVDFDPYRSGWQYVCGVVSTDDEDSVTNKQYTAVHLYIMYDNQMNPGYFTDVQFIKDDSWSYTYDSKGNLNTAKKTRENNAFQHNSKDQISRMSAMDGTAYDIYYNAQRMPLYAKSAEGQRSYFWYNKKGQPTSMSIEADKNSAAVTVGRVYYIRQQRSGKYLDTKDGDVTGSNVQQYQFNGSDDQKWKVENAGDGYIKLISQSGGKSKAVDVFNTLDADKTNIQLYLDLVMTLVEHLQKESIPHGPISIAFTPDEEIGTGASHFDVELFGADFAYTLDGSTEGELEYENFNACSASFDIHGVSVHPGSAKDTMINACLLAMEINSLLPLHETPRDTEGYEGFYHLINMNGDCGHATLNYIVRDHDTEKFQYRKDKLIDITNELNKKWGENTVELHIKDQYYNMKNIIEEHMHLIDNAKLACERTGLAPIISPIRGGTDGCQLSFRGLPCPDIGTGAYGYHGPYEHISAQSMDKVVNMIIELVRIYSTFSKEK